MDLLQMFRRPLAGLAGAVAVMLLASAAAQAFTLEDQGTASGGAAAKFSDPADRVKSGMSSDSSDKTRVQSGNTTLQFGGRSTFDERNNADRYFSPNNLMGR
jgi:hypothetical protein